MGNLSIQAIASATTSFPLTFLWYQNGNLISTWSTNSGSLGNTLVISNAVPTNSGKYSVIISNFVGTTNWNFTVAVNNPYLAAQPQKPRRSDRHDD